MWGLRQSNDCIRRASGRRDSPSSRQTNRNTRCMANLNGPSGRWRQRERAQSWQHSVLQHGPSFTIILKLALPLSAAIQHNTMRIDPLIPPFLDDQEKLERKAPSYRGLYGAVECDPDVQRRLTAFLTAATTVSKRSLNSKCSIRGTIHHTGAVYGGHDKCDRNPLCLSILLSISCSSSPPA